MTAGAVVAYLAGLFASYLVGLKFGVVAKAIKDLGTSA